MSAAEQTPSPSATRERGLVERIARELAGEDAIVDVAALAGDESNPAAIVAALQAQTAEGAILVCAGVLERLAGFGPVVEALVAISAQRAATVVLAVPNDAYPSDGSLGRGSSWGDGAVAELRRLLPSDHRVFHQVALRGSALVAESESVQLPAIVEIDPRATAPVAFVLAFGPRAARLEHRAEVAAADVRAERDRERALVAELSVLRATSTR
jgi:hypothetical protein